MTVKTAPAQVTVTYVQSSVTSLRTHNRTEWAHQYTVSSSVDGIEQADLYVAIAPSDLQAWLAKFVRALARLHKSNPDRFNALLASELPTLPGHKWQTLVINPGQNWFRPADPDQWANAQVLYHIRAR